MRILCTSDLHGYWRFNNLPEADVMVFAGDLTPYGKLNEVAMFNDCLLGYPAKHKIVVAGNHDWAFYDPATRDAARRLITNAIYLQDESVVIDGVKFYGSPWTPQFFNWAFMLSRGPELKAKWDLIDSDTSVLVTHGPPAGKCDYCDNIYNGCTDLRDAVERIKPKLHIFGHVHEAHGSCNNADTIFVNASRCTRNYDPFHDPMLIEI